MDLVVDHMLQSLVISWTEEGLGGYSTTGLTVVEGLIAVPLVSDVVQLLHHLMHFQLAEHIGNYLNNQ